MFFLLLGACAADSLLDSLPEDTDTVCVAACYGSCHGSCYAEPPPAEPAFECLEKKGANDCSAKAKKTYKKKGATADEIASCCPDRRRLSPDLADLSEERRLQADSECMTQCFDGCQTFCADPMAFSPVTEEPAPGDGGEEPAPGDGGDGDGDATCADLPNCADIKVVKCDKDSHMEKCMATCGACGDETEEPEEPEEPSCATPDAGGCPAEPDCGRKADIKKCKCSCARRLQDDMFI